MPNNNDVLAIGKSIYRGEEKIFGIKLNDRRRHMYILGKTGSGKTTLLERMAYLDIIKGNGIAYIDPHGESVNRLLHLIPKQRIEDVIYFNPQDIENPIAFNPLQKVPYEKRHLIAYGLLSVFKKIWVDMWSTRMEYILTNTILALLEWPDSTILDINRMLSDDDFRKKVVANLRDVVVKSFWEKEFSRYATNFRTEAIAPIQNKVGQFITSPLIRNIIGQPKSSFDLREIMDRRKILLINLSKGAISAENSALLGGLLISALQLTAFSRIDIPEEERQDFFVYIDEFQEFSTESFVNILAEARKYRLNLILAHQFISQIPPNVQNAIFGNVGTMIIFRIGSADAEILIKEFEGLKVEDFTNLPNYHAYVKLLVDGQVAGPFLCVTFPPVPLPEYSFKDEIIYHSRLHYSEKRSLVEARISSLYKEILEEKIKSESMIHCQICNNLFWSRGDNICEKCRERSSIGYVSFKQAINKGLITEFEKKKDIKTNPELDDILKILE